MVGQQDSTDHQANHSGQHGKIQKNLHHAKQGAGAAEKRLIPIPIEDVMNDKEDKHGCPHPFVGKISPKLISHQKKQRQAHQRIHKHFYMCFWFHNLALLSWFTCSTPTPPATK